MRGRDYKQLSKTISHALRHDPAVYDISLDEEGWAPLSKLLEALHKYNRWSDLNENDIQEMNASSPKMRFEIKQDKIRALYGHSLPGKVLKKATQPPQYLYHGTSPETAKIILKEGLQAMERQYVHLSSDARTARSVGMRKTQKPVILIISALDAYNSGVQFYLGNDTIWLADEIPPQFISADHNIHS